MATKVELPVKDRLLQLFQHLGIERAHLIGYLPSDWRDFVIAHPKLISSLTLVCPHAASDTLSGFASPLLVLAGDQGPTAARLSQIVVRDTAKRAKSGSVNHWTRGSVSCSRM